MPLQAGSRAASDSGMQAMDFVMQVRLSVRCTVIEAHLSSHARGIDHNVSAAPLQAKLEVDNPRSGVASQTQILQEGSVTRG